MIPSTSWRDREVLLAFNGPQLVLVEGPDGEYLSVASDEDENAVRWLRSRVSKTELRALLAGGTTVRECLLKPDIWVVDTSSKTGELLLEAKVGPDDLTDEDIPAVDSYLPEEITAANRQPVQRPSLTLDGTAVLENAIGFRPLAEVLQNLQRLWNAIGQTLSGRTTSKGRVPADISSKSILMVDALVPGSVGIELKASDEKVFEDIAAQYRRLLESSDDAQKLRAVFSDLKARVRATYADYVSAIERNGVEVLARWQSHVAFLSPATAMRIRPALAQSESGQEEVRLEIRGFFVSYSLRDATFELVDKSDGERYGGRVSQAVLRNVGVPIVIGPAVEYDLGVSITTVQAIEGTEKQLVVLEEIRAYRELHPSDPMDGETSH